MLETSDIQNDDPNVMDSNDPMPEPRQKRTRKAKDGGASQGVRTGGVGSGVAEQAVFILVGNDKTSETATEKADIEKLIGKLLTHPTEYALYKGVRFVPEFNL